MNSPETAQSAPLEANLRSYVAALATIHVASAEVVNVCRALVEEQLPTFSRSLGVTATAKDIKDDVNPKKLQQFGEHWAWIGVTLQLVANKLWFSVGLYIDETDETNRHVEANAIFYTSTWAKAESLLSSLSDLSGQAFALNEEDDACVCALEPVPENALGSYPDTLKKAVQRWVGADGGKALSIVAKNMELLRR